MPNPLLLGTATGIFTAQSVRRRRLNPFRWAMQMFAIACLISAVCEAAQITVTPANLASVITPANAGATFNFAPGNYTLITNPAGPAADWSAVPGTFVGNGAIFALSGGEPTTQAVELIKFAAGSSVSGFVFTDAQIHCEGGTFNVTHNTFLNSYRGIYVYATSGHFDSNAFSNTNQEAIYGYPGSNCTYDNNLIDNTGNDGIHLIASPDSVTVSNNVITRCNRFGIELQNAFTNLTVSGNYVAVVQPAAPASAMAYSIATGNGTNITITGNTAVSSRAGAGAAFEIMGSNASITNNFSWGFGMLILNGAQGSTLKASGNTVWGGSYVGSDHVSWPIAQLVSSEAVLPLTPTPPAAPNAVTTSSTAASTPTTAPAIPTGLTVAQNSNPGQLVVRVPAGVSATLSLYASTQAASTAVAVGSVSDGTIVSGIPNNWWVTPVVTIAQVQYTLPKVQIPGGSVTSLLPVIVTPTAATTQPTLTHTIITTVQIDGVTSSSTTVQEYSDGSITSK